MSMTMRTGTKDGWADCRSLCILDRTKTHLSKNHEKRIKHMTDTLSEDQKKNLDTLAKQKISRHVESAMRNIECVRATNTACSWLSIQSADRQETMMRQMRCLSWVMIALTIAILVLTVVSLKLALTQIRVAANTAATAPHHVSA